MVVCKMAVEIQLGVVSVVAELALGEPLVVQLGILVRHVGSAGMEAGSSRRMKPLLLTGPAIFLLHNEVHIHHEGGGILLQQLCHHVVLQPVVEQQRDS